jgi:hypothetical protein
MSARIVTLRGDFFVTVVYAPTDVAKGPEKDAYFLQLQDPLAQHKARFHIVLGDFNAQLLPLRGVIGEALQRWAPRSTSKANEMTNGEHLAGLAVAQGLKVANSYFKQCGPTWHSPDGVTKNYIDHILVSPGLIPCCDFAGTGIEHVDISTDHEAVHLYIGSVCRRGHQPTPTEARAVINRQWLRSGFADMDDAYAPPPPTDIDEAYGEIVEICHQVYSAAPAVDQRRRPWISQATLDICKDRDRIHGAIKRGESADRERYRALCAAARRSAHLDKGRYWEERSAELEHAAAGSNSHWFHAHLRKLREPLLKALTGTLSPEQWRDYFSNLLNVKRDVSQAEIPVSPPVPVDEAPEDSSVAPSRREFEFALGRLKNYKSGGADEVVAEVLKYSGRPMEDRLFALIRHVWATKKVPKAFRVAQLLPLWKRTGSPNDPTTYRGIALLAVVGKILSRIISHRMCPYLEDQLHDIQCGTAKCEPIRITTGVRQGCLLSCALFNVVMEAIARKFIKTYGNRGLILTRKRWRS